MPELTTLMQNLHALADRAGANDRILVNLIVQCIGELARISDRLTQFESWAVDNGYTGYTSTESTETENGSEE